MKGRKKVYIQGVICRYCNSSNIRSYGKRAYLCDECKKTFRKIPRMRLKGEEIPRHVVSTKLSENECSELKKAAKNKDISVSKYVRDVILAGIEEHRYNYPVKS